MTREEELNEIEKEVKRSGYSEDEFERFRAEYGWADWMNDYTDAAEDEEISESEGREIDEILKQGFRRAFEPKEEEELTWYEMPEAEENKYNRLREFFDGKTSYLGDNAGSQNFEELYDWVHREFPRKDMEHVLLETVSRMIHPNVHFGDLEPAKYDDVYDKSDGADQRFDVSDDIAKRLIDGDIPADWTVIQDEVNDFASRRLQDLKDNDPGMQVTDRINSAFNISANLYPEFRKLYEYDFPEDSPYSYLNHSSKAKKDNKKAYIEKAWAALKSDVENKNVTQDKSRRDMLVLKTGEETRGLLLSDFEALIKGLDAARCGEESLSYIRPDADQILSGFEEGWEFDEFTKGYAIFQNPDSSLRGGLTPKFISKLDEMDVFESDSDAAEQWEQDTSGRLMQEKIDMWIGDGNLEYYSYPDTPENRAILEENGWLLERPLEFDFSEFTENDFNKIRDELLKDTPEKDYYGRLHIGSLHVEFVIEENSGKVDTNYYILGEEGEGKTGAGVPYDHFLGNQLDANLFTDNTYDEFMDEVSAVILADIAEESSLKPEAMRPLVDWTNEQQCKELYSTKLVESAINHEEKMKDFPKLSKIKVSAFDKELQEFMDGRLPKSHIFSLGSPSEILVRCGFPARQRIELSASHLEFKSRLEWHPFEIKDVMGLEEALKNPVAVFEYGDRAKSQNVIVSIEKDGKKFLAGVHFNQEHKGFEISTIRTLFPKDNIDWLRWIEQGKMIYGSKEKLQALIAQQRINVADVSNQVVQSPLHEHCLESSLSILDRFGEVKDIFTDEHPFYEEVKEKAAIEKKFYTYYTEKGNLDARELSVFESVEFYNAIKKGDTAKIEEYTKTDLHEISELAAEIYKTYSEGNKLGMRHNVSEDPNYDKNDLLSIKDRQLSDEEKMKIEKYLAGVTVSEDNFRDVFNEAMKLPRFKDRPLGAAGYCLSRVPEGNKDQVVHWLNELGCKTKKGSDDLFNKWNNENKPKAGINKSRMNDKDDWSISD